MAARLLPVLVAALLIHSSHQQGALPEKFVEIVAQTYSDRINSQLQQLIASYVRQEVTYTAYASYFERADVGLPGLGSLFSSLAKCAGSHALNLTDLINHRGGVVIYPTIQLKDGCAEIKDQLSDKNNNITHPRKDSTISLDARTKPWICYFLLRNWDIDKDKDVLKRRGGNAGDKTDDKKDKKVSAKKSKVPPKKSRRTKRSFFSDMNWFQSDSRPVVNQEIVVEEEEENKWSRELWQNALYGLEDALAMERSILREVTDVTKMARAGAKTRDPQVKHYLQCHQLTAQVHSVYHLAELVTVLQRHQSLCTYDLEEYVLDNNLLDQEHKTGCHMIHNSCPDLRKNNGVYA